MSKRIKYICMIMQDGNRSEIGRHHTIDDAIRYSIAYAKSAKKAYHKIEWKVCLTNGDCVAYGSISESGKHHRELDKLKLQLKNIEPCL